MSLWRRENEEIGGTKHNHLFIITLKSTYYEISSLFQQTSKFQNYTSKTMMKDGFHQYIPTFPTPIKSIPQYAYIKPLFPHAYCIIISTGGKNSACNIPLNSPDLRMNNIIYSNLSAYISSMILQASSVGNPLRTNLINANTSILFVTQMSSSIIFPTELAVATVS